MLNNEKIVRLLLLAGAGLDKRDGKGRTVFHIAVCYHALKALNVIISDILLNLSRALQFRDYQGYY